MSEQTAAAVVSREELETFFEQINDIDEEIKSQNADKKEAFEMFSEQKGVDLKGLKKAHKEYNAFLKNPADYHAIDGTTTTIMNKLTGGS